MRTDKLAFLGEAIGVEMMRKVEGRLGSCLGWLRWRRGNAGSSKMWREWERRQGVGLRRSLVWGANWLKWEWSWTGVSLDGDGKRRGRR